jgi:hypothetical protein
MTYTLIAHQELSGGQTSIEFASIPATFTDLILVGSLRITADFVGRDLNILFNGLSTNHSSRTLFGSGNARGSFTSTSNLLIQATNAVQATTNTFSNFQLYIPNYRIANAKNFSLTSVNENNATEAYQILQAGAWNSTSAITSITLTPPAGTFVLGSSVTLYGITAGSSGGVVVS